LGENEIITTNEGEHEFEVTSQTQEEESEIQEEMSEIPQHQEDVREGIEEISLRRSTQVSQISTRLHDIVTYKVQYLIQNFLSYNNIVPRCKVLLTSISKGNEPTTYQDPICQPVWYKAMSEELKALEKNELGPLCNYQREKSRRVQMSIQPQIQLYVSVWYGLPRDICTYTQNEYR
jgi:hypothetical protein